MKSSRKGRTSSVGDDTQEKTENLLHRNRDGSSTDSSSDFPEESHPRRRSFSNPVSNLPSTKAADADADSQLSHSQTTSSHNRAHSVQVPPQQGSLRGSNTRGGDHRRNVSFTTASFIPPRSETGTARTGTVDGDDERIELHYPSIPSLQVSGDRADAPGGGSVRSSIGTPATATKPPGLSQEDWKLWVDIQAIRDPSLRAATETTSNRMGVSGGVDTKSPRSPTSTISPSGTPGSGITSPVSTVRDVQSKARDVTLASVSSVFDAVYRPWPVRMILSFKPARKLLHVLELIINSFSTARREFSQRKINFLLGFLSCFVLVCIVLVLFTVLQKIPIVYLRMVEQQEGEIDLDMFAESWTKRPFLNYPLMKEMFEKHGDSDLYYHSPRFKFTGSAFSDRFCNFADNDDMIASRYVNVSDPLGDNCHDFKPASTGSCLSERCSGFVETEVIVIDTYREDRIGIGRQYELDRLGPGQVHMHETLARALGVSQGDMFLMNMQLDNEFKTLATTFAQVAENVTKEEELRLNTTLKFPSWYESSSNNVVMPLRIVEIFSSPKGKVAEDKDDYLFMEMDNFIEHFKDQFDPYLMDDSVVNTNVTKALIESYANHSLPTTSSRIVMNLPPERFRPYLSTDFEEIQKHLISFGSDVTYVVGYGVVEVDMPLLSGLQATRFLSLFLGLIVNIVILMLSLLCVLLVYSLMMSSLETRVWELGVRRMVGMSRAQMLLMLCIQAETYGVPATILGLSVGLLATWIVSFAFATSTGLPVSAAPDWTGFFLALGLGLLVPLVAGIFPIRNAMKTNLHDALSERSGLQTKGVVVKIRSAADKHRSSALMRIGIGLGCFGFGFMIYYFFPLALLMGKLAWLANIFFLLIVGMLLGLVLLTLNLQHVIEKFLVFVFLFWERRAVKHLIAKNLVSHRMRNQKTTMMYAVSVGIIIFGLVSYETQLFSFIYREQQLQGALVTVTGKDHPIPIETRELLEKAALNEDLVTEVGWDTWSLEEVLDVDTIDLANVGQLTSVEPFVRGATPNFFASGLGGFLDIDEAIDQSDERFSVRKHKRDTKQLNGKVRDYVLEELYTPFGRHSIMFGSAYKKTFSVEDTGEFVDISWKEETRPLATQRRTKASVGLILNTAPGIIVSQFPNRQTQDVVVSIPHFLTMVNDSKMSVSEVPMSKMMMNLPENAPSEVVDRLVNKFEEILDGFGGQRVWDYYSEQGPMETATSIVTAFFAFATVLALFVSFFSLSSSMQTNILEQTSELAVMRSLGVSRPVLTRIYVWESVSVVVSACFTGIGIGTLVSWTMTLQNRLFTELPIPLFFPWEIALMVLVMSLVMSVFGAIVPSIAVMRKSIVEIGRMQH